MTIGEIQRMSGSDIQNLYEKLPEPYYPTSINTDPDSLETILSDFSNRKPSTEERTAIQNDLAAIAKLGQTSK